MERWRLKEHRLVIWTVVLFMLYQNWILCFSLNDEGLALLRIRERVESDPLGALSNWIADGVNDPCLWFGVECSDGIVVALKLKDLCLGGSLAPEFGNLVHIKSIILRNNSLHGSIPKEIGELKELEELDLGYNNFSGPLPYDLSHNLYLGILLLDNNDLLSSTSPEIDEIRGLSEVQVDESQLSNGAQRSCFRKRSISRNILQSVYATRRLLQLPVIVFPRPSLTRLVPPPPPSSSPSPSPSLPPSLSPSPLPSSPQSSSSFPHLTTPSPAGSPIKSSNSQNSNNLPLVLSLAIGVPVLLLFTVVGILFCKGSKIATVRPWATGLSGQLQKAFVTGVPKLRRSELEIACEDFSNVIGSSPIGTLCKGTLSSGVEISVASVAVASAKDWSNNLETQFRNKIDELSKVNHKNFGNLLGYCEEDQPFTRMLVFEYAPNGTLFEHLHIREAEHLDWGMRMRIIMGIAYCLEHMHRLTPPVLHKNLTSSSVHLTEDYAAKVLDFGFWSDIASAEMEPSPESNVYNFGVILFEIVTGRLPYSDGGPLDDWASNFLRGGGQPISRMVDPTLESFEAEQLEQIGEVIRSCVYHEPKLRPKIQEVASRLREITGIRPDDAIPKLSPLWWAELQILSAEAS